MARETERTKKNETRELTGRCLPAWGGPGVDQSRRAQGRTERGRRGLAGNRASRDWPPQAPPTISRSSSGAAAFFFFFIWLGTRDFRLDYVIRGVFYQHLYKAQVELRAKKQRSLLGFPPPRQLELAFGQKFYRPGKRWFL
jgi:hypothetical protein